MKNFKSPETDFIVVKREGEVNLETGGGFFSCFGVLIFLNEEKRIHSFFEEPGPENPHRWKTKVLF